MTPSSSGDAFLRLCEGSGSSCVTLSRFFSLILASAQLVGSPFSAGSYVGVMVGVTGTYFESYYDAATGAYSDVRLVYQNFGVIGANALAFLLLMRGIPVVQFGTEYGFALSQQDTRASMWPTGFNVTAAPLHALIRALHELRRNHRLSEKGSRVAHMDASSAVLLLHSDTLLL